MLARLKHHRFYLWLQRNRRVTLIGLVVLITLILIFRPKGPKPLETYTVKEGSITQSLTASGSIQAKESVTLSFLAGGKVTYVGAREGDPVLKGQTLASLDQRSAQKNIENAVRDYSKQRNNFEQTKKDNNPGLSLDSQPEDIKRLLQNNQYDLEKTVASVELQELARQNSVLTSPINGILIKSDVPVAGVNVGPTSTFVVADPESLVFEVDVDEADIGKVTTGQQVTIILEAFPDDKLRGTVQSIDFASHKTDTGGNAFTVEVGLPFAAAQYRIGMNGDAEIVLDQRSNTLTIPISAIVDDTYVYKKTEKGYEKTKVSLGLESDIDVEVREGLKAGEIITTQPDEAEKITSGK